MKIPKLNIGGLIADIPIIQGGMGVGISGPGLQPLLQMKVALVSSQVLILATENRISSGIH